MPRPHGGKLVNRLTKASKIEKVKTEALEIPKVSVSHELRLDFENIAFGLYSPLKGPLTETEFDSVVSKGRLSNDIPWSIPILLDVTEDEASKFNVGDSIAIESNGELFAVVEVDDKYGWDKEFYSTNIYKTIDSEHPGVAKTNGMKPVLVGGSMEIFNEHPGKFPKYRLKPEETRFLFKEKGWRTVAGFQT
ncbi:sulfate adenylyltransferase, partial [Candidatus Bathyarchaeota archaeon]|nr:sulfate adenylyltransferase [Candidatus Bathyarchaeota archaeon]